MNWSQPCCDACWMRTDVGGGRVPYRMRAPEPEVCAWCGNTTRSGIYKREHPANVPHPAPPD